MCEEGENLGVICPREREGDHVRVINTIETTRDKSRKSRTQVTSICDSRARPAPPSCCRVLEVKISCFHYLLQHHLRV
jgi:hypothetical protein